MLQSARQLDSVRLFWELLKNMCLKKNSLRTLPWLWIFQLGIKIKNNLWCREKYARSFLSENIFRLKLHVSIISNYYLSTCLLALSRLLFSIRLSYNFSDALHEIRNIRWWQRSSNSAACKFPDFTRGEGGGESIALFRGGSRGRVI